MACLTGHHCYLCDRPYGLGPDQEVPKVMGCGHTLGEQCMLQCVDYVLGARMFPCPQCLYINVKDRVYPTNYELLMCPTEATAPTSAVADPPALDNIPDIEWNRAAPTHPPQWVRPAVRRHRLEHPQARLGRQLGPDRRPARVAGQTACPR